MDYRDRISSEPGKRGGRPCLRGTRIAVADVLGWLASGLSHDEIAADFPEIGEDEIRVPRLCGGSRASGGRRGMKLLFDQSLSHKLPTVLSDLFPGSTNVRLLDLGSANDRQIWDRAEAQGFDFLSLDADFAELAQLRGPPPKVIWLQCGHQPTRFVADLFRRRATAIQAFGTDVEAACLELY